ncbi:MAG: 30S ribosomal protein S12 methylthiotransferase RimO [Anaerovoracaceae bacterium]|nr:30S ribosomal protein S12 methylthiotransferase RimO [Anaerovoracaceae bacterium]
MNVYIETMGCPKNKNDSENAAGILRAAGHGITADPEEADAIIVNTCGFIEAAKRESIDRIFDFIRFNDQSDGRKLLIVTGCLSQRYGRELFDELPEVDIFMGVNDYEKLPEILSEHEKGSREKYLSAEERDMDAMKRASSEITYSRYIKIAEGCDNRCTYCIIPMIRGKFRSRPMEDIVSEAEMLAGEGCRELVLIAEDTSAYGIDIYGRYELPALMRKLCAVDGIEWIRLMYCYEERITDELISVMAGEDKICKYIDIPLQHASDNVLRRMNRKTTNADIRGTVARLRAAMPDIHIRTTLITGFPGETEDDFAELYEFCEEMKFERLGVFTYSREEGTPAAEMDCQIDEDVKERRLDAIMTLQRKISLEHNRGLVGTVQRVLIESKDSPGVYIGRTQYDAPEIDDAVIVRSRNGHRPGDMTDVLIEDAFDYDITGTETGEQK